MKESIEKEQEAASGIIEYKESSDKLLENLLTSIPNRFEVQKDLPGDVFNRLSEEDKYNYKKEKQSLAKETAQKIGKNDNEGCANIR